MFDSLILAAALLVPANRDTADRLPGIPGISFVAASALMAEREGKIVPPCEAVALATRPAVEVRKPYLWDMNVSE